MAYFHKSGNVYQFKRLVFSDIDLEPSTSGTWTLVNLAGFVPTTAREVIGTMEYDSGGTPEEGYVGGSDLNTLALSGNETRWRFMPVGGNRTGYTMEVRIPIDNQASPGICGARTGNLTNFDFKLGGWVE